MYSIVLADGKTVKIMADSLEWNAQTRTIKFAYNRHLVARINMNNIVGWIESNYMAEREAEDGKEKI